jgi:isocitrate dehydrogenase
MRQVTKTKSMKITKFAFDEAKRRGWKKVVAVSKANVLKVTDGLFLECARNTAKGFPGIKLEDLFVDNFSQQLVKNPQRFNKTVIVGTNLFMDIISEEASGLIGSIGMVYSGNFGEKFAMFEPAHGSSPKYAGQNKVNPTATVLSGAWMLDYLGEKKASRAVFDAAFKVISRSKDVTYDLGGTAGTQEMARAISRLL